MSGADRAADLILFCLRCQDAVKAEAVAFPVVIDWPAARRTSRACWLNGVDVMSLPHPAAAHPAAASRGTWNSTLPSRGSSTIRGVDLVVGLKRKKVLILDVLFGTAHAAPSSSSSCCCEEFMLLLLVPDQRSF